MGSGLSPLQQAIIQVADSIRRKQRSFDMAILFERCSKKLSNPRSEIDLAIRELYKAKYFIEGKPLFKEDILKNETRANIFEYILNNPGAHEREIRRAFKLGGNETFIQLSFLIKYGFIRKRMYKNKSVYFPMDFDERNEKETLFLKTETAQKIYEYIKTNRQIKLPELTEHLKMPINNIQYHLRNLLDEGFIKNIQDDHNSFYILGEAPLQEELKEATLLKESESISSQQDLIEVKREYDYLGGQIHFKIALRNFSNTTIHNIGVTLNPSDQFIVDTPQQNIANLLPNTTRGIDFFLTPLSCGQSNVFGAVSFADTYGRVHSIPIQPKEISIKCPLVQPLNATQSEVNEWLKNLKQGTSKINYHDIPDKEAFRIGREQITALDLNEIKVDSNQLIGLYSGKVKVTENNVVIKISVATPNIILDVWADDLKQTTGLLAYIVNLINLALEVAYKIFQKTKDINQKVINLLKISNSLEEVFTLCENQGLIREITQHLSDMQRLFQISFPDSPLTQQIHIWNSKLVSMFDSNTAIEVTSAMDLQFNAISWLFRIHELFQHFTRTYQESFDNLGQLSDEISTALNLIKEKITDHERTYGLSILSYLLLLDKRAGLTIFEKAFYDLDINPDLIGGFLHALQSFGTELSKSETSIKTLTYENYKFQIATGNYIRAALIMRGNPNQFVITRLEVFVKRFEEKYKDFLVHFTGDISRFRATNELFESIFK